ncbi:MAG: histidine kinase [Clostridia bacterium]|nr:histidine kinase [Clostridia bacterium]
MKNKYYSIVNTISTYKGHSIFFKYIKIFFITLFVPFLIINILIFANNVFDIKDKMKLSSEQTLMKGTLYIDELLKNTDKNVNNIINSDEATHFFNYCLFNGNLRESSQISQDVYDMIYSVKNSYDCYSSIYFYSEYNDYFISTNGSNFPELFYDKDCVEKYFQNSKKSFTAVLQPDILTVCYSIPKDGAVFFNISLKKIFSDINDYSNYPNAFFILTLNSDNVIFSDNPSFSSSDSMIDIQRLKQQDAIYSQAKVDYENMTLFHCIPKSTYYEQLTVPLRTSLLFLLLSVIMMLLITLVASFKLYESILQVVSLINFESNGKQNANELVTLTNFILDSVQHSKNLEYELAGKISKLRQSQSIALQTQLNPHFLFNTLNLISCYVLEKNYEDTPIITMIDNLSEILRYSLDTDRYLVSMREEIEIAKKYVAIENLKHQNSVKIVWNISESVLDKKVLKMILQPILENAFKYGALRQHEKEPYIEVTITSVNDTVTFKVIDNGPQIPADKLEQIRSEMINDDIQSRHIGLRNLHSRIHLLFGEKYGCKIKSENNFTTVTITIPNINNKF